jgi:hypothetical protein
MGILIPSTTKSAGIQNPPLIPDAGGGGTSLYDLAWTTVDLTDGSWTLVDPDSLLDSVTHSGGYNTATWAGTATGDLYRWDNGTSTRAPRWYKDLLIDGTQVTTGDLLTMSIRSQLDNSVDDFDQGVVFGASVWPDLNVATSQAGIGAIIKKTQGGFNSYGAWTVNSSTMHNNREYCVNAVTRGGGGAGSSCYQVFDASNTATGTGARASNQTGGSTTLNVRIMVGIGLRLNNDQVNAGNRQRFQFKYAAYTNPI